MMRESEELAVPSKAVSKEPPETPMCGEDIYRRSRVLLNRPKNPDLALASELTELVESFRADSLVEVVQLPAPPRPTCQIPPSFIFFSRVFWRSRSSSKENAGRSVMWWMFPAPPRPALYLDDDAGRPASKREAGPQALRPSEVFGARKVFPAPPRPERTNLLAVGWGSVMEY